MPHDHTHTAAGANRPKPDSHFVSGEDLATILDLLIELRECTSSRRTFAEATRILRTFGHSSDAEVEINISDISA